MSYTFKMVMHGIMVLVEPDKAGAPYQLLVPDTTLSARTGREPLWRRQAKDGDELMRHQTRLVLPGLGLLVEGHTISVTFPLGQPAITPGPDLAALLRMKDIAGTAHGLYAGPTMSPAATALLTMGVGKLSSDLSLVAAESYVPTLSGVPPLGTRKVATEVWWIVEGLSGPTTVSLITQTGHPAYSQVIDETSADGDGLVEILLLNQCSDGGEAHHGCGADEDFKWYYEWCSNAATLSVPSDGVPYPRYLGLKVAGLGPATGAGTSRRLYVQHQGCPVVVMSPPPSGSP